MYIDYCKCKALLANSRRHITEDEWYDYLEKCYPEWWESLYNNKLRVTIIYYDDKKSKYQTNTFYEYPFYIDKKCTMNEILKIFHKFLIGQKLAINMCFGNDISDNIIKYLPKSDFDPTDNYIYVHKRNFNTYNTSDFTHLNI